MLGSRRYFSLDPLSLVTAMTTLLELIHALTGIPWWGLIPLATFGLRSVWTMPLAVLQRRRIQKQSELRPIVSAMLPILKLNLAKRVNKAKVEAKGDKLPVQANPLVNIKYEEMLVLTTKEVRKRQKKLFKDNDVQMWKNFILPAFQIPLWVLMSLSMRDLSGWSTWFSAVNKPLDSSLYTEGALWFQDLAVLDPFCVFPILIGITSLANVEWLLRTLQLSRFSQRKRMRITIGDAMGNILKFAVVFLMGISLHAPVALCLYWLSSQVYSLVQSIVLDTLMPVSYLKHQRFTEKQQKNSKAIDVINRKQVEE